METTATREETDSLGPIAVPRNAYYGAQTARAMANFPISGIAINHFPIFIRSLGFVKKAAAQANLKLGDLETAKASNIIRACDELIEGGFLDQFPVDVFQGGAGTSTNMNVNEVLANRALELMGYPRGRYDVIHPNNDVNMSQSTNDVYPTAIRIALLLSHTRLQSALEKLADAFEEKAAGFKAIPKLGRTQLQDAVPMTLGDEFLAFAVTLREDNARLREISDLFREINLGGTAIGTSLNAKPEYRAEAVRILSELTGLPLVSASNLVEASWDTGAFVLFSGMLKRTATKLSKICNDLRLLSSGPRGGLNEINLPPMQPGSSIMPGKVNPVIPEVVNQVAFQIIGYDLTITFASEAGQLQLNVMEPVIMHNLFSSLQILERAVDVLRTRCVSGITANPDYCSRHLGAGTAYATFLTPILGYERATELAKEALALGVTIPQLVLTHGDMDDQQIERVLSVIRMTPPPTAH
jgi:aspartate ammonia-lyase